jgi:hypothetical protein
MGFSPAIREQAMVDCARRCCLCHKYCAVKIECAHIDQEADGGLNEADNCIPVCFDCHADIGHYNTHHPRGTKFTSSELKKHRDRWYKQVLENPAVMTPDYKEVDAELFLKVFHLLGGSSSMMHFKNHDYGAPYSRRYDDRIIEFQQEVEKPETEFLNFVMESSFADLKAAIRDYFSSLIGKVWLNTDGTKGIPEEWTRRSDRDRGRFDDAQTLLNGRASEVWEKYSKFVGDGRRLLLIKQEQLQIKEL